MAHRQPFNEFFERPDGVIEIALTQGKSVLIDAVDLPLTAGHRWYAEKHNSPRSCRWYAATKVDSRVLRMHRLLLRMAQEVDHINGDGLDNRRLNIRPCTRSENMQNLSQRRGGSSRYKGVYWQRKMDGWCTKITVKGRNRHLGSFTSELDAAHAYDSAARQTFGQFARCNFGIDDDGNGSNGRTGAGSVPVLATTGRNHNAVRHDG